MDIVLKILMALRILAEFVTNLDGILTRYGVDVPTTHQVKADATAAKVVDTGRPTDDRAD